MTAGPSRAGASPGYVGGVGGKGGRPSPLTRVCPKCEAGIGWRCHRLVGGVQRTLSKVHPERQAKRD